MQEAQVKEQQTEHPCNSNQMMKRRKENCKRITENWKFDRREREEVKLSNK
jgi:hypothetical protein